MQTTAHNFVGRNVLVMMAWMVATPAVWAGVSHTESPLPYQNAPAVDTYMTTGAGMKGMSVTAFFSTGASETVFWNATGVDSGEATGTDWSLKESGDTFVAPWTLTYTGADLLVGLRMDGFAPGPGNVGVMFDRTFPDRNGNGQFGTPDSFLGRDLELVNPLPFDVFVNYEGTVGVGGNLPVGDEFRWLNIRFSGFGQIDDEFTTAPAPMAGLGENNPEMIFRQDSNNIIVPEPASLLLVGCGALGLVAAWRRRRKV